VNATGVDRRFLFQKHVTAIARALEVLSITAVARALDALSRNSAKKLASTSTHCDCYERAVIIRNYVVDEYSWHLATSRMDVTSMISNDVADEPRSVSGSGMEVLVMHTDSCGRRCSGKQSPFSILGTDQVALEPARVLANERKGSGSGSRT